MGEITGKWLAKETKVEILGLIGNAAVHGVSVRQSCSRLRINRSRITRWRRTRRVGGSLENGKPGPEWPLHRLLPVERETMVALARREDLVDLSHRELTVAAWDKGLVFVSFSTTYRILKAVDLMGMRGKDRRHNGHSVAPVRKNLTGANQRWCWDISYLLTPAKGHYLCFLNVPSW